MTHLIHLAALLQGILAFDIEHIGKNQEPRSDEETEDDSVALNVGGSLFGRVQESYKRRGQGERNEQKRKCTSMVSTMSKVGIHPNIETN